MTKEELDAILPIPLARLTHLCDDINVLITTLSLIYNLGIQFGMRQAQENMNQAFNNHQIGGTKCLQ